LSWLLFAVVALHLAIVRGQENSGPPPADVPPPPASHSSHSSSSSAHSGESSLLDPLGIGSESGDIGNLPPFDIMNAESNVAPNIELGSHEQASLDIGKRIKSTEDLLNRMVWQLNRETSWANSVHDIIQNYQYKYTKVLSAIKQHTDRTGQMRGLLSMLKKARLHEVLEADLSKATRELTELASTSAEASGDEGSYSALKDRISLMKQDLEKMSKTKVNAVLSSVQQKMRDETAKSVPAASSDLVKNLVK